MKYRRSFHYFLSLKMKRTVIYFISTLLLCGLFPVASSNATTDDCEIYYKTYYQQGGSARCYIASCAMIVANYKKSIGEDLIYTKDKKTYYGESAMYVANGSKSSMNWATLTKFGMHDVTIISSIKKSPVYRENYSVDQRLQIIVDAIQSNPYGIFLYFKRNDSKKHAVVAVAYKDGVLYVNDPARNMNGEGIPLTNSYIKSVTGKKTQSEMLESLYFALIFESTQPVLSFVTAGAEAATPQYQLISQTNTMPTCDDASKKLLGWSTSPALSAMYLPGQAYQFSSSTILYAHWQDCFAHTYDNSGYCTKCGADFLNTAAQISPVCNKLVTIQDSPIRSRPYTEGSTIIATIPSGQTVYSTGCLDNHWAGHLWYQVTYNGVSGYIYKDNVTVADTKSTFLLNFNPNGGNDAPGSIIAFCADKTTLPAAEPTKSGAAFKGWATNPNAFLPQFKSGGSYSIFAKANEQITLYAVWSNSFGVTTETASPSPTGSPTAHVCTYGSDGYCTVCGHEYPCVITPVNATSQTVKEGVPIWSRPYSTTSARMDQAEGVIIAKSEQFNIDASVINHLGNIWYRIANGRFKGCYIYSENVTLNKAVSNTPTPTPSSTSAETQVSLCFHANGGSGGPGMFALSAGNGFVIPADQPVRSGYRFVGWAEFPDASASSGSVIYGGTVIAIMSSITLYAVWEPDETGAAPAESATPSTPEPTPYVSSASSNISICLDVPCLLAGDTRWSNLKLGSSSYTVGKSGGLITCMAMYESYRLGTEETPATLIKSGRAKFSNDGGLLFACDLYKPYKSADFVLQTIYDLLSSDKPVIVWANNGGKHFAVFCYAYNGDPSNMELSDFSIYDPLNGTSVLSDWSDFSRVCYYP